jgi:hypothetical protein
MMNLQNKFAGNLKMEEVTDLVAVMEVQVERVVAKMAEMAVMEELEEVGVDF